MLYKKHHTGCTITPCTCGLLLDHAGTRVNLAWWLSSCKKLLSSQVGLSMAFWWKHMSISLQMWVNRMLFACVAYASARDNCSVSHRAPKELFDLRCQIFVISGLCLHIALGHIPWPMPALNALRYDQINILHHWNMNHAASQLTFPAHILVVLHTTLRTPCAMMAIACK